MSHKNRLIKATFVYFISRILIIMASLISFPIITRILTVNEYGILGVCNTTLLMGSAVSKLGLQNAILRYYGEYRKRNELGQFYSTYLFGGLATSTLITLVMLPVTLIVVPIQYRYLFLVVLLVIFGMPLYSIVINFLRAEEKVTLNSVIEVAMRYLGVFSGIALICWFGTGVVGIFAAQFVLMFLLTVGYILWSGKKQAYSVKLFSRDLYKESISFGLPLVIFELSGVALAFSDRYLIINYSGTEQLGYYMAGYTICFYIAEILKQTLSAAVMPIYMNIYAEKGLHETAEFIKGIIPYVFLVIAPVFAGCVAIKTDMIILLASGKYAEAAEIVPWVLAGTLLYACQPLVSAGFYIKNRTRIFSFILFVGAIVNIFMNVMLIPRYGIIAAAWSTAVSYIGVLIVMAIVSNRFLPISYPVKRIILYSLSSLIMYFTVDFMDVNLALKIIAGAVLYIVLVFIFDRGILKDFKLLTGRPPSNI